jgi:glycosyltransferase involved in cell wall biosynthesis/GT2 family glycosyltransferase
MSSIPVPGLQTTSYVYEHAHLLLHPDASREPIGNIGVNGINLTISFLSLNRANLSKRLLESIKTQLPHFQGEVLIVDNGSDESELAIIREAMDSMSCRCRLVELGKNYGVGGARNRTIPHVKTDWLMCLDNDIFFISNPLETIQRDLSVLGCHFMSLPLLNPDRETLFALGGHLYVSHCEGAPHVGAGSVYQQAQKPEREPAAFLSTFLFGGSCVFSVKSFQELGGYDENMFIGFEDIDFSIRLFQKGLKVGSSGVMALIHDHPAPTNSSDTDYERKRFSKQVIKESAEYLRSKHGFEVWSDAVGAWLDERHSELGLEGQDSPPREQTKAEPSLHTATVSAKSLAEEPQLPSVALVLDTYNWAFGNIARQLEKNLSNRFRFNLIPMDVIDNIIQVLLIAKDSQVVHFFWREHLALLDTPYYRSYAEHLTGSYQAFVERYIAPKKFSTSVYDHLLLKPEEIQARIPLYTSQVAGYTVSSQKLAEIYTAIPFYPRPWAVIEDGVDLNVFKPKALERLAHVPTRDLVIGWVGNSAWASELEDFKGVHTILKPAIEGVISKGAQVRPFLADRQERFIPHEQMPDYYSQIDVLVCTSKIEGTPNPVLEAMACGVPVISTDVGIVPQAFGPLQKQFILKERSSSALEDAIMTLRTNPQVLVDLSQENLRQIQAWDWPIKAKLFGDYFERLLQSGSKQGLAVGA